MRTIILLIVKLSTMIEPLSTTLVKPYLEKRKRQRMEYKEVDGLARKSSQLEGVLLKCDIDLNSNINNINNNVATVKNEVESDPLTLIIANEDVNSYPNFDSDQFNLRYGLFVNIFSKNWSSCLFF